MGFLGRLQERGGRGLLCMRHARLTSHTIIAIALTTLFLSQIAILAALMSARFLTVVSPERRRARTSGAQSTKRRQLMPCIQRARKKRKIIYQIDIHIKGGCSRAVKRTRPWDHCSSGCTCIWSGNGLQHTSQLNGLVTSRPNRQIIMAMSAARRDIE